MNILKYFVLAICLIGLPEPGQAQATRYVSLNSSKARPLAMGGAFTSITDAFPAVSYNPAAVDLYSVKHRGRLTLFLNPVAPVVGGLNMSDLFSGSSSPGENFLLGASLVLKSLFLSLNSLELGIVLGEQDLQLPQPFQGDDLFSVSGFRQNHAHTVVGRLRLAEQVAFGVSASLMYRSQTADPNKRLSGVGVSYGILLEPEKGLSIGVSLVDLPDSLHTERLPLERIVDETVNVGVSYNLWNTTVSLDIRNLGEDDQDAVREFHIGLEQVLLSTVAVRAGWYKKDAGGNVYSWGLGLLDGNKLWGRPRQFGHNDFLLNYAFVLEEGAVDEWRYHVLSAHFRI